MVHTTKPLTSYLVIYYTSYILYSLHHYHFKAGSSNWVQLNTQKQQWFMLCFSSMRCSKTRSSQNCKWNFGQIANIKYYEYIVRVRLSFCTLCLILQFILLLDTIKLFYFQRIWIKVVLSLGFLAKWQHLAGLFYICDLNKQGLCGHCGSVWN